MSAPALENGLLILEIISQEEIGFNNLLKRLKISRSTLVRLLTTLVQKKYLAKTPSGKYKLGHTIPNLIGKTPNKHLVDTLKPSLIGLSKTLNSTILLLTWENLSHQVVYKESQETSPMMLPIDNISYDLSQSPWGWHTFYEMSIEEKKSIKYFLKDMTLLNRGIQMSKNYIEKYNFCFDNELLKPYHRRLSALIRNQKGNIIGAIAVGGNSHSLPDEMIVPFGRRLNSISEEYQRLILT